VKAIKASYHGEGNSDESPLAYCLRKCCLLHSVFDYDDTTLILEVLEGVPQEWQVYINVSNIYSWDQFTDEVNQHEHILTNISKRSSSGGGVSQQDLQKLWDYVKKSKSQNVTVKAKAHAVEPLRKPNYPKDDATKSKDKNGKLRTPASLGKRPCRHCGSGQHWDSNCKYRKLNATRARAQYLALNEDEMMEEDDYERAQVSDIDQDDLIEELEEVEEDAEQDF
jgi:hypothetical protein